MKKSLLCAVLLAAVPALAAISKVQSAATWNSSGPTCNVSLTGTTAGNLIALWITWLPSSLTLNLGYTDPTGNAYASAVGPTIQSASNTAAQIVYAKSIAGGTDVIHFPFTTGSATSVSCVAVEYSGLDTMYPLDSVSEAISNNGSPSGTLDSGTATPANANLLVFGGGTSDSGTVSAGSGFTSIQSHSFSSGSAITEQNSSAITGNNTLQRATAGLPLPATGNWLMQMAVFRAAAWTTAGGTSSTRQHGILYADQFPGNDIGAQINAAAAALPLNTHSKPAGVIAITAGSSYSFSTPIFIKSPYVALECNGASLTFTGSGSAITLSDAPTTYGGKGGIHNCHLSGNATAGQIGITLNEVTWSKIQSVDVYNFVGSGSIGILFSNTSGSGTSWTENNELDDVQLLANTTGIAFQDNCPGHTGCNSFAYNHFYHVDASIPSGDIGFALQYDAALNGGSYDIRCRGDAVHAITCLSLTGTASINLARLDMGGENGAGGGTGVSSPSGTTFAPVNLYEQWNSSGFTDSLLGTYVAYIYTPLNIGHIIGARQGLSIGNTSNAFLATLSSTSLSAGRIFTFPDASGTFLISGTPPTVSSGFGTSPAVVVNNGTAAFTVNVGSGGTATTGILAMPTAANGWNCQINDLTAAAANVAYNTRQTASTTATVTLQNQTTSTGAAVAWGADDILGVSCFAY